jgi:hypothetical protein
MKGFNYSFQNFRPKLVTDLVRIGNKNRDGGYIISERQIGVTKVLIGLGVNDDWSFEEDFKQRKKDLVLYCYDFSVGSTLFLKDFISSTINVISLNSYTKEVFNGRSPHTVFTKPFNKLKTYFKFKTFFDPKKNNFFIQKGVSDDTYDQFITPKELFANITSFDSLPENSVFIKMDIEESEYDILDDILDQKSKINGMTIEFHNLRHLWKDFNVLLEKIKEDFEIIHIHGNNCCGYIPNTFVPNLVEISFMKRNLLKSEEITAINSKAYPVEGLDKPNFLNKPDLKLSFD